MTARLASVILSACGLLSYAVCSILGPLPPFKSAVKKPSGIIAKLLRCDSKWLHEIDSVQGWVSMPTAMASLLPMTSPNSELSVVARGLIRLVHLLLQI